MSETSAGGRSVYKKVKEVKGVGVCAKQTSVIERSASVCEEHARGNDKWETCGMVVFARL